MGLMSILHYGDLGASGLYLNITDNNQTVSSVVTTATTLAGISEIRHDDVLMLNCPRMALYIAR